MFCGSDFVAAHCGRYVTADFRHHSTLLGLTLRGGLVLSITAKLEPRDHVDGKHELAAACSVVIRPRAECVLLADFRTHGEQLVEAVRYTHGPTVVRRRKARPLALYVDQVVDRPNREKILLREFPFGVIDDADCRRVSGNQSSWTYRG